MLAQVLISYSLRIAAKRQVSILQSNGSLTDIIRTIKLQNRPPNHLFPKGVSRMSKLLTSNIIFFFFAPSRGMLAWHLSIENLEPAAANDDYFAAVCIR